MILEELMWANRLGDFNEVINRYRLYGDRNIHNGPDSYIRN